MHGRCDFAILGATPFAALLALVLSEQHGFSCCLVGRFPHPLQLSRGMDLSVAALTRPESLALIKACATEGRQLIAGIGREVLQRTDVAFTAAAPQDAWTLRHLRQMLHGYGYSTEALTSGKGQEGDAVLVGDVHRIVRRRFYEAMPDRLQKAGVKMLADADKLEFTSTGGLSGFAGETEIEAEQAVIADDAAAWRMKGRAGPFPGLEKVDRTVLLTSAGARLRHHTIMDISTSDSTLGHADGSVEARVGGDPAAARRWLAGRLLDGRAQVAGCVSFAALASSDGGPVIGRTSANRPPLALGLGPVAAFMAPAVARYLAGRPEQNEELYFADRVPGSARSKTVADLGFAGGSV